MGKFMMHIMMYLIIWDFHQAHIKVTIAECHLASPSMATMSPKPREFSPNKIQSIFPFKIEQISI